MIDTLKWRRIRGSEYGDHEATNGPYQIFKHHDVCSQFSTGEAFFNIFYGGSMGGPGSGDTLAEAKAKAERHWNRADVRAKWGRAPLADAEVA